MTNSNALHPAGPEQADPMQPAHPTAAALAEWRELALAVDGYPLWHVEPSRDAAGMMSVRAGHWKDGWDDDDGRHGEFVCDGCTSLEAAYIAHSSPDRILALLTAYEAERARADAALLLLRECREHVEVSRDVSQQDCDLYRGYAREARYQAEVDEAKALLDRIDAALAPEGGAK